MRELSMDEVEVVFGGWNPGTDGPSSVTSRYPRRRVLPLEHILPRREKESYTETTTESITAKAGTDGVGIEARFEKSESRTTGWTWEPLWRPSCYGCHEQYVQ